jgi:hypothetical protein
MGKREPNVFEDNPFIEGLLEWMSSPEGQLADEARELVWPMLRKANVDAKRRKIVWEDGQRLSITHSARRIHAKYPHLPLDLIEDKIITWLETFAPETYSPEQLDELDELTEEWECDHYQARAEAARKRGRTPHS